MLGTPNQMNSFKNFFGSAKVVKEFVITIIFKKKIAKYSGPNFEGLSLNNSIFFPSSKFLMT